MVLVPCSSLSSNSSSSIFVPKSQFRGLSRFLFNFINDFCVCVLIPRAKTPPMSQQWAFLAFWLDLWPSCTLPRFSLMVQLPSRITFPHPLRDFLHHLPPSAGSICYGPSPTQFKFWFWLCFLKPRSFPKYSVFWNNTSGILKRN